MAETVGRMTKVELLGLIEETVDRRLADLARDPDEGLVLRKPVRQRLARQKRTVASGERGLSLTDVVRDLGLS